MLTSACVFEDERVILTFIFKALDDIGVVESGEQPELRIVTGPTMFRNLFDGSELGERPLSFASEIDGAVLPAAEFPEDPVSGDRSLNMLFHFVCLIFINETRLWRDFSRPIGPALGLGKPNNTIFHIMKDLIEK